MKRETLCVCRGSFLAELFSGRWDQLLQKDDQSQFFLDIDPAVFEIVLAWLRDCKIESPTRPASCPTVPVEHMQHFQAGCARRDSASISIFRVCVGRGGLFGPAAFSSRWWPGTQRLGFELYAGGW